MSNSTWAIIRRPTTPLLYSLFLLLAGCSSGPSEDEIASFATLYSELLIAESMYATDSSKLHSTVDSLLDGTDFDDVEQLLEQVRQMTESHPEKLRHFLDSTESYLQRVRLE